MAKKGGSGKHYVSKGERPNVSRGFLGDSRTAFQREIAKLDAWQKNKKAFIVIDNTDAKTAKSKKTVRVDARQLLGDPRKKYDLTRDAA